MADPDYERFVEREIGHLKELLDRDVRWILKLFETVDRLNQKALDAALAVAKSDADKIAKVMDEKNKAQNEWRGTVNDIISRLSGKTSLIPTVIALAAVAISAYVALHH